MGIWKPDVRVESNRTLELNRSNPLRYSYTLPGKRVFAPGTTGVLTLKNTFGQTVGAWMGTIAGGTISFVESADIADAIPRGTSWTILTTDPADPLPTMRAQGTVIRSEAPFPDAPPQSSEFDGVQYQYSFATPGFVVDPAWRIMNGNPRVYDNSAQSLPNAVGAGSLLGGDLAVYDDVAMLWFAPLLTDSVRLTYNTIRIVEGSLWVVICSNYDMTNYAAIKHTGVWLSGVFQHDTVEVVTGSGPVTTVSRGTPVDYSTATNQNYTAEYNPITNTYSLYVGTSLTPTVSWQDTTNIVTHGEGERYVGFGFKSSLLEPGIEISDWIIGDSA